MLKCFDHFFVQDDYSQKLLEDSGFKNISLSGDTRFDRVLDIASQKREIKEIEMFKSGEKMMVLGSVWPSDMDVLLPFLQAYSMSVFLKGPCWVLPLGQKYHCLVSPVLLEAVSENSDTLEAKASKGSHFFSSGKNTRVPAGN